MASPHLLPDVESSVCRWLLNTQVIFLRKDREPANKVFDDDEWLSAVPETDVDEEGPEAEADEDMAPEQDSSGHGPAEDAAAGTAAATAAGATATEPKPKVRPIQMGEFLR